jgi:hypothetical protein
MGNLFFSGQLFDADSMLAAGGGYLLDNTSIEGHLSMMILGEFGNYQPLWRVQTWALERLIALHLGSGDLRWAMIALALRSLSAAWALGRTQIVLLLQNLANRAGEPADTTVAAGCR